MGKLQKDSRGFSAVVIVLVLVIVGLLGFVGWYVVHNNKKDSVKPATSTAKTEETKQATGPTKTVNETADWTKVSSANSAFSFKAPDGWKIQNWTSRDYLSADKAADTTYVKGTAASVTNADGTVRDSGTPRIFSVNAVAIADKAVVAVPKSTPTDFVTTGGLKGKKYIDELKADPNAGVTSDMTAYEYRFETSKHLVVVSYYVLKSGTDSTSLVEQALKTLEAN